MGTQLLAWDAAHVALAASLLLVVLVLSISLVLRARLRQLRQARQRVAQLERALEAERDNGTAARRLEQELAVLGEFVHLLPETLYELDTSKEVRNIPPTLLRVMLRVFGAQQAAVLVRCRGSLTDLEREHRLVVAAVTGVERELPIGTEVGIGEGQLGLAAEAQRVMDRQDHVRETGAGATFGGQPVFDVVAPMLMGDNALGVIAYARPKRRHPGDKDMLRLIAQIGALALHNVSTFRHARLSAEMDELTGIFNKRALNLRLSELVYEARHNGNRVAVFMFDIDHFKNYNDLNGHLAGDQLLRVLSQLVRDSVRVDDIFGRFGGEEFLLIMPGRTVIQAMIAAEKVRRRVEEYRFAFGERQPLGRLTVSGGVACFPDDARDAVELLTAADAGLYRAKELGRNCVLRTENALGTPARPL